tara:strand:+ start:8193 stop:9035 length:843 start_codon:yes stop_codon:yes gene_type:complete
MDSLVWFDGNWHNGNKPIISSMSQSYMHGSTIFDGARAYSGLIPDLHLHCERLFNSAKVMGLEVPIKIDELVNLCKEGIAKFDEGAELYIRPSVFCDSGFLIPEKNSSNLVITIFRAPMPSKKGFTAMLSSLRRPHPKMAPTLAKASSLYANTSLALSEASKNGFDNVVMRDGNENVVEFGSANLFLVKNGRVFTPEWNKTFLNGITKKRTVELLEQDGVEVTEKIISVDDLLRADEVFSTGNYGKVLPVLKINNIDFKVGMITKTAMSLYQEYAKKYKV